MPARRFDLTSAAGLGEGSAMLGWLRKLVTHADPPHDAGGAAGSCLCVVHDEAAITLTHPDGREEQIRWSDVACVAIHTTDAGPFVTDLFWHIEDARGQGPTVPMGAAGEQELLRAMQRRLEGFDNMAVIEAMGSAEEARFVVWEG
jgi:hypothetical protein